MSTDPSSPNGPEYLETGPTPSRKGPRTAVLGLAAVAVAGAVGVGGWAAVTLMSGGSQPTEAIPANALGYVAVDLDPSASQKVEAFKILQKFPALSEKLEVSSQDDLRRWMFEKAQEEGTCTDLDYDEDVAPWIGDRLAMAMVPAETKGESPTPVVALQVSDEDAAADGIAAIAECGQAGEDFGFAFTGGYAVLSDSTEHAEAIAGDAEQGSLADDGDFQAWMDRLGEPGVLTIYMAPGSGAVPALMDLQNDLADDLGTMAGDGAEAMEQAQAEAQRVQERLVGLYDDFAGGAGVVRFADGAVETEFAYDGMTEALGFPSPHDARVDVAGLPAGSAAVAAASLPEGWVTAYLDLLRELVGDDRAMDQVLAMLEGQTGLAIPQDIERLLGDGVALTVGEDLDVRAAERNPTELPIGLKISGDPREIVPVVEKVERLLGPDAQALVVQEGEGAVALGVDEEYVEGLLDAGGLDGVPAFQDAVPEAQRAASVLYLNFDTVVAWMDRYAEEGTLTSEDKQVRENLEPLRAFGLSTWAEEDADYTLLRLSTD